MKIYTTTIGIDNGSTGSIGIIQHNQKHFFEIPTIKEANYQKTKQATITRIDVEQLSTLLQPFKNERTKAFIERPLVNPRLFTASLSGVRALEALLICLDQLDIPCYIIDSKAWQHNLLPGVKGRDDLKAASMQLGMELAPEYKDIISKHGDADGLLIAEHFHNQHGLSYVPEGTIHDLRDSLKRMTLMNEAKKERTA